MSMGDLVVREVDVRALAEARKAGAFVLDVREPYEFDSEHLAGVVLIPMRSVPSRLDELPKAQTVFVICRSGHRSMQVCRYLGANGLDAVNVAGGMVAWSAAGLTEAPRPTDTQTS